MSPRQPLIMKYVRIQKMADVVNVYFGPCPPGVDLIGSAYEANALPPSYWIEGWLVRPLTVGKRILVARILRNGVKCPGHFVSTSVIGIRGAHQFATRNSVYQLTEIPLLSSDWLEN